MPGSAHGDARRYQGIGLDEWSDDWADMVRGWRIVEHCGTEAQHAWLATTSVEWAERAHELRIYGESEFDPGVRQASFEFADFSDAEWSRLEAGEISIGDLIEAIEHVVAGIDEGIIQWPPPARSADDLNKAPWCHHVAGNTVWVPI
jgi:hypothetical protein